MKTYDELVDNETFRILCQSGPFMEKNQAAKVSYLGQALRLQMIIDMYEYQRFLKMKVQGNS